MKTKKFFMQACLFCLLVAGSMNAYGMAFENKFEQATETFGVGVNKSSINPGDNPNGTPPIGADGPIGDGIGVLSVLGIVYALYQHRKRKVPVSVE